MIRAKILSGIFFLVLPIFGHSKNSTYDWDKILRKTDHIKKQKDEKDYQDMLWKKVKISIWPFINGDYKLAKQISDRYLFALDTKNSKEALGPMPIIYQTATRDYEKAYQKSLDLVASDHDVNPLSLCTATLPLALKGYNYPKIHIQRCLYYLEKNLGATPFWVRHQLEKKSSYFETPLSQREWKVKLSSSTWRRQWPKAMLRQGREKELIQASKNIPESILNSKDFLGPMAVALLRTGNFNEALTLAKKAKDINSLNITAFGHWKTSDYDIAYLALEKALKQKKNSQVAIRAQMALTWRTKNFAQSYQRSKSYLGKINPFEKAALAALSGHQDDAIKILEEEIPSTYDAYSSFQTLLYLALAEDLYTDPSQLSQDSCSENLPLACWLAVELRNDESLYRGVFESDGLDDFQNIQPSKATSSTFRPYTQQEMEQRDLLNQTVETLAL